MKAERHTTITLSMSEEQALEMENALDRVLHYINSQNPTLIAQLLKEGVVRTLEEWQKVLEQTVL